MQEGTVLPAQQVNRDLLRSILDPPGWFWPVVALLGLIVLVAFGAAGYIIKPVRINHLLKKVSEFIKLPNL